MSTFCGAKPWGRGWGGFTSYDRLYGDPPSERGTFQVPGI